MPEFLQLNLFSFGNATDQEEDNTVVEARVWHTSLDEFKPLTQKFFSSGFKESYYAKSLKTGEYHVIKKYYKGEADSD